MDGSYSRNTLVKNINHFYPAYLISPIDRLILELVIELIWWIYTLR